MAMTKCKECGAAVSSKATACPSCGAPPPKRTSLVTWIVAAVLIPSCAIGIFGSNSKREEAERAEAAKTPAMRDAEARSKAQAEAEFQRAVLLAKVVKQSLKNPGSFELSSATQTTAGAVCLVYRATNSFNAKVPGYAVLTPDNKTAAGSSDDVSKLWNKYCASQPGRDMIHIRHAI